MHKYMLYSCYCKYYMTGHSLPMTYKIAKWPVVCQITGKINACACINLIQPFIIYNVVSKLFTIYSAVFLILNVRQLNQELILFGYFSMYRQIRLYQSALKWEEWVIVSKCMQRFIQGGKGVLTPQLRISGGISSHLFYISIK